MYQYENSENSDLKEIFHLNSVGMCVPHVLGDVIGPGFFQLILHPRIQFWKDRIILQKFGFHVLDVNLEVLYFGLQSLADNTERLDLKKP